MVFPMATPRHSTSLAATRLHIHAPPPHSSSSLAPPSCFTLIDCSLHLHPLPCSLLLYTHASSLLTPSGSTSILYLFAPPHSHLLFALPCLLLAAISRSLHLARSTLHLLAHSSSLLHTLPCSSSLLLLTPCSLLYAHSSTLHLTRSSLLACSFHIWRRRWC